ncbi:MAG: DUF3604 domain-containing protein, partial [Planctomycetes bacterium]|nr:DUF3604 domain-containing protein [Planctomycetota bacterium]
MTDRDTESGRSARAFIEPADDVTAGQRGTWRLVCEAGEEGIAVGGGFRIDTDTDSDWGTPQFTDPAGQDYATVESPDGVSTSMRTTGVKSLQVTIHGRSLRRGEQITLVLGDTTAGGPGSRAQTFVEEKRFFWIGVDAAGNGEWRTLDDSPSLCIRSDKPVRIVVVAPSMPALGDPFRLLVRVEDKWGNPVDSYRGTVRFVGDGIDGTVDSVTFTAEDGGARWIEGFSANRIGVVRVTAADAESSLQAESNPVVCTEHAAENQLHWADPHGGQLVLNSKIAGFFRHARDVAGVQFVGYQRNADVISAADWEEQQRQEREFYEAGRFVPIPGFEWSGKTWHGGHHNVYFRRHNQPVRRNEPIERPDSVQRETELRHIEDVYAHYRHTDTILTMHVGGEHSNLQFHDPSLETGVDLASTHGS